MDPSFIEVEVTRPSADGGIDGQRNDPAWWAGQLQRPVSEQALQESCPDVVRDFRGAMVGDGAPPIDLIDGRLLGDKLKELRLGIRANLVEHMEITDDWFASI